MKRFFRSSNNYVISGVCGGIKKFLDDNIKLEDGSSINIPTNLIRFVFLFFLIFDVTFFSFFFCFLYFFLWFAFPRD